MTGRHVGPCRPVFARVSRCRGGPTAISNDRDTIIRPMSAPPDSVDEDIIFSNCPSTAFVRVFVRTDLVTMISHERLEQSL